MSKLCFLEKNSKKNKNNCLTLNHLFANIILALREIRTQSEKTKYNHIYVIDSERYRSGHNEAVLKTVCPQGRKGSNPFLSAFLHNIWCKISSVWRSTQAVEGAPLERVQVVNSGARVQIPPSPFLVNQGHNYKAL